jgi:hypothetical protein
MKKISLSIAILILLMLASCNLPGSETSVVTEPAPESTSPAPSTALAVTEVSQWGDPISWSQEDGEEGLYLDSGGDVDTEATVIGDPAIPVRITGNGQALLGPDGNIVEDSYMQFNVDDEFLYAGSPTTFVQIEVEYFDQGTDTFSIQYDAIPGGPSGDGRFVDTGLVFKTATGEFMTMVFRLNNVNFANRDNGADFRIADGGDGAEYIRRVTVSLQEAGPTAINVDICGANPYDSEPDSDAIQDCINLANSGDTITFTSPGDSSDYRGYLIDKTIFLVATSAKHDLTFTSTDPDDHAMLQATADLLGFVVRMWARSQVGSPGAIDNITISHLDIDGGQDVRVCYGSDNLDDGRGDNWGSWLPECSDGGDPWCSPGGLAMSGAVHFLDPNSDYQANPDRWSTGNVVDDVYISNVECATALAFDGAAGTIRNSTIENAGDHVHEPGCSSPDPDEGVGDWSDGITFIGPGHLITGNTIINASDVGIVHFGGVNTIISNNTIRATEGNYGMFAAIAIHPWHIGNISGGEVSGNVVTSEADENCGGIHAGINIGTHMWNLGCTGSAWPSARGTPNDCVSEPQQPMGKMCIMDNPCQQWAYVAEGTTFILQDNFVKGAQINFLVEGLDLMGEFIDINNTSEAPRRTDWVSSRYGCQRYGSSDYWNTLDFVAHHPTLDGWTDQRVHCER